MSQLIWTTSCGAEYGRADVNADNDEVREKLINLLESEWHTFGESGDSIIVE